MNLNQVRCKADWSQYVDCFCDVSEISKVHQEWDALVADVKRYLESRVRQFMNDRIIKEKRGE